MRPKYLLTLLVLGSLVLTFSVQAKKKKTEKTPDDLRNIVTSVDQSAHTVTITYMESKTEMVYTMADPSIYPVQIFIDGEQKQFSDIKKGLQLMTDTEIANAVFQSISFRKADAAPNTKSSSSKKEPKTN